MWFGSIGAQGAYEGDGSRFQRAFDFLKRGDLAALPEGWIELGDGVRASVQHYSTSPERELNFETHEQFFDVQYLVEGLEFVGVCTREGLEVETPYEEGADVAFYRDPPLAGRVLLRAGDYVALGPGDAHKPRCAAGTPMAVKKIVVKVPV